MPFLDPTVMGPEKPALQQFTNNRANGVDITNRRKWKPLTRARFLEGSERARRSRLFPLHPLRQPREVPGHIGSQVLGHPLAGRVQLVARVVLVRNEERRDLEPYARLAR